MYFARYAPLDIAFSRTAAAPSVMHIKTAKNPSEAMVSAIVLSVAIREIFPVSGLQCTVSFLGMFSIFVHSASQFFNPVKHY